jgi:SAM-dependent methyltransferase
LKLTTLWQTITEKQQPARDEAAAFEAELRFMCNICGTINTLPPSQLDRESRSCRSCGSTLRFRSIVHLLSCHLFGKSLTLEQFPQAKHLKGIGMTDWAGYASVLEQKLAYTNTYYHQEPRLDIIKPPADMLGTLDFIITSDVMEHVPPPIQTGFDNLAALLKPGGVLVLTVPFGQDAETREHFPELFDFRIVKTIAGKELHNTTRDGRSQIFGDLIFHGGDGSTLEMRLFCESALVAHLHTAGFENVVVHAEAFFDFGIYSRERWSLPMTATRKK